PQSWRHALQVAGVFGEAALNGSDQVRLGVATGERVRWGPVSTRDAHLRRELARIAAIEPSGHVPSFERLAANSLEALSQPGLLVVISDWLVEGFAEALRS